MMLAHFYHLTTLEDTCATFLLDTVTVRTVCATFGTVHLLDNELTQKCLQLIQSHTYRLFDDQQHILDLNVQVLEKVFQLLLNIPNEVWLFAEMLKWARRSLAQEDQTAAGLRKSLRGRLNFVRFSQMTVDQFTKCVDMVEEPFFTMEEVCTTLMRIVKRAPVRELALTWHSERRTYWPVEWVPFSLYGDYHSASSSIVSLRSCNGLTHILNGFTLFDMDEENFEVWANSEYNKELLPVPFSICKERVIFKKTLEIGNLSLRIMFESDKQGRCLLRPKSFYDFAVQLECLSSLMHFASFLLAVKDIESD